MPDLIDKQDALDAVHHTIYEYFDEAWADEDSIPLTPNDRKLLELNKAICSRIKDLTPEDVVERKDLDEIIEAHGQIGYDQGYQDGYAQAMLEAIEAVGLNTWAGSRISQLQTAKLMKRRADDAEIL